LTRSREHCDLPDDPNRYDDHLLADAYLDGIPEDRKPAWLKWMASAKSGVLAFPVPAKTGRGLWGRSAVATMCDERGVSAPTSWQYVRASYSIRDFDFDEALWAHWRDLAKSDDRPWVRVLEGLLRLSENRLKPTAHAQMTCPSSMHRSRTCTCGSGLTSRPSPPRNTSSNG
jgi:hypothetical protein